jgi:hypothetical protein
MPTFPCLHGATSPLRQFFGAVLLGATIVLGAATHPARAASDVPLVVKAMKASASLPANAYVQATVTLSTLSSTPNQPKTIIGQGKVTLEGNGVQGDLPMTFDAAYKPAAGTHILKFKASRKGRVGLQWMLNGSPLDGNALKSFELDASEQALSRQIEWNGAPRMITVTFETKMARRLIPIVVGPIKLKEPIKIIGSVTLKPTPTPTPVRIISPIKIKLKKKPTGRKIRIESRFLVTNSDDGVGGIWGSSDNRVELHGTIQMGGVTAFQFNNRSAGDGDEFTKTLPSIVLRYNDPNLHFFKVGGKIWDRDKASSSDTLFNASQNVDLLKIMESNREYLIKGDRKSESGDLYIRVIDEGEVFD